MGIDFIYYLGSGSSWDNNEIRYSVRSVEMHHPDSNVIIVGEKPEFWIGEHHYVADGKNAYVNAWRKIEFACMLRKEFILMNDDFFLRRPLDIVHYYSGTLKKRSGKSSRGAFGEMVRNTYKTLPDSLNFMVHVPLYVCSWEFLEIAKKYPERYDVPTVSPRQVYCHHSKVKKRELPTDVKGKGKKYFDEPFFSTTDSVRRHEDKIKAMYPKPSRFEKCQ